MKGFPGLTVFGLVLLALIFAVGFSSPDSSKQLFSTLALVAGIAAACWIGARITRNRAEPEPRQPTRPSRAPEQPAADVKLPSHRRRGGGRCAVWPASPRLIAHRRRR